MKLSPVEVAASTQNTQGSSLEQTELFINRGLFKFKDTFDPEGFILDYLEGLLGKLEPSDFSNHLKSSELQLALSRILVEDACKRPSKRSDKDLERTPAIEVLEKATREGVTKSSEYDVIYAIAVAHMTLPKRQTRHYNLVRNTLLKIFQVGIAKQNLSL